MSSFWQFRILELEMAHQVFNVNLFYRTIDLKGQKDI